MPRRFEQDAMIKSRVDPNIGYEKVFERKAFTTSLSNKGPIWLVTFVDLVSLLLVFFIMLYSMSSLNPPPWKEFKASLNETEFKTLNKERQEIHSPVTTTADLLARGLSVSYLLRILETGLANESSLNGAVIKQENEQLFISLPYDLFFAANSDKINQTGKQALFAISETLSSFRNRIDIVGWADTNSFINEIEEDNWTGSIAKAVSVGEALIQSGYSKPLAIRGALERGDALEDEGLKNNRKDVFPRVDLVIYAERDSQ